MFADLFPNPSLYTLVILPLLIFLARVGDMTLDTLRISFIARGRKGLATCLGFFEILIWLFAIAQVLQNLSNPLNGLAYAGGFATGTFMGMTLEKRLALGRLIVRVITRKDATELIQSLRSDDYGLTVVEAEGRDGPVKILFSVIKRRDLGRFQEKVKAFNPQAFISVEDIREAQEGRFPSSSYRADLLFQMPFMRKGI